MPGIGSESFGKEGTRDEDQANANKDAALKELLASRVEFQKEEEKEEEEKDTTEAEEVEVKEETKEEPARTSEDDSTQAAEQKSEDTDSNSLTTDQRFDIFEKELALRDTQIERLTLSERKWESLAQRRAGAAGYQPARVQPAQKAEQDDDYHTEIESLDPVEDNRRGSERVLDEFQLDQIEAAQAQATAGFLNKYNDIYIGEEQDRKLDPEFVQVFDQMKLQYQDEMLNAKTPKKSGAALDRMLREARLAYREGVQRNELVDARKKRAVVTNKARERRAATQVVETKGTPAPTTEKSFDNMTADEMAKALGRDRKRSNIRMNY